MGAEGDQDVSPAAPDPSALRSWCFPSAPRRVPAPGALQGAGLSPGCYAKGTETPLPRVPEGSRKRSALGFTRERIPYVLLLFFPKKCLPKAPFGCVYGIQYSIGSNALSVLVWSHIGTTEVIWWGKRLQSRGTSPSFRGEAKVKNI